MRSVGIILPLVFVLFLPTFCSTAVAAYHSSDSNTLLCSDCHTLHYSEGDVAPARAGSVGPYKQLLLQASVNALCQSCHDGTDASAPIVFNPPGPTVFLPGDEHSGAGYFPGIVDSNTNGHGLGVTVASPPLSTMTNVTLNCASCHQVHGNGNYRNLLTSPGAGPGTDIVRNVDVYLGAATGQQKYSRSNSGYKAKMSAWCAECHNSGALVTTEEPTQPTPHYKKHPVNRSLNSQADYHTSTSNWLLATPSGVSSTTGDGTFGIPRVRFQRATATSFASAVTVNADNQVFCGTCHLAHGWRYRYGLAFPLKESGGNRTDAYAACQQCHNQ